MGVEDPAGERAEHRRPDDPHVAGEDDDVRPRRPRGRRASGVVGAAAGHERGVDPLLRRPVERRAGPIGEDEHDLAAELAARRRREERPQVATRRRTPRPRSGRSSTRSAALERSARRRAVARRRPRRRPPPRARRRASAVERRVDRRRGDDDDHPDAAVERRPQLVVARARRARAMSRMTDGIGQRSGSSRAPKVRRQRPRHVAGQAAAGDVGEAAEVRGRPRSSVARGARGPPGVDPRRRQQHLAERRAARARAPRAIAARGRLAAERPRRAAPGTAASRSRSQLASSDADEREAVGVEPGRRQADDRVAGPRRGAVDQLVALDDADAEAGEVERRSAPSGPGCSAVSPPTSAQPASRQPVGDAADELRRPAPGRAARPRRSRGRTAARRRCRRRRRRTSRRGRRRSCRSARARAAIAVFVPTPSVDETSTGSR